MSKYIVLISSSSVWSIDRTLSSATAPGQCGPGSNDNEGVLCISQSSSITGASPSDCIVSFGSVLPLCRDAVCVFYSHNQRGQVNMNATELQPVQPFWTTDPKVWTLTLTCQDVSTKSSPHPFVTQLAQLYVRFI